MLSKTLLGFVASLFLVGAAAAQSPAAPVLDDNLPAEAAPSAKAMTVDDVKVGTTLENLMAAFNGESNANAKYLLYAEKAQSEGYGDVASLFRAAAKAEEVHAANHAEVIKRLGGKPEAKIEKVQPKTTAENLKDAIEGESYERDLMYPAFMKVARADRQRDAMRTINYAQVAEAGHAKMYTEAAEDLVRMTDSAGQVFYVCPTCGYTVTEAEYATFTKCPVCFTSAKTFEKVS